MQLSYSRMEKQYFVVCYTQTSGLEGSYKFISLTNKCMLLRRILRYQIMPRIWKACPCHSVYVTVKLLYTATDMQNTYVNLFILFAGYFVLLLQTYSTAQVMQLQNGVQI
jgi:hypothetical protein